MKGPAVSTATPRKHLVGATGFSEISAYATHASYVTRDDVPRREKVTTTTKSRR